MKKTLYDESDIRLGFPRTKCGCNECTVSCRFIPGMLIPSDLARLAPSLEWSILIAWAKEHLLASVGALILRNGVRVRVPSLVPARSEDGSCHWLGDDDRCQVHKHSPYGCSHFDAHMRHDKSERRSLAGILAVEKAHTEGDLYSRLWHALNDAGFKAPTPEESRQRMANSAGFFYPPRS